ncbi:hypothetical protein Cgig2_000572 [Carnegiea gigantea]|uniref:Photosystem II 5 kDa protein, chloroplastic n=1 Tax=Carnegiea gigantea TaxID=171969 RepID=A0A9Q1JI68_9CARY|nr:hypothetical protein Cgig2_000572 [Carnegiea gigantea]
MASLITMPASFLGGSATATATATATRTPPTTPRCGGLVVAKATMRAPADLSSDTQEVENSSSTKRRDLVVASVAAAACSLAKMAMAEEEPKRGTPEARKKYAPPINSSSKSKFACFSYARAVLHTSSTHDSYISLLISSFSLSKLRSGLNFILKLVKITSVSHLPILQDHQHLRRGALFGKASRDPGRTE